MKAGWKVLIIIDTILIIALSGIVGYGVYIYGSFVKSFSDLGASSSLVSGDNTGDKSNDTSNSKKEPQLIFEDDFIKVSFIDMYDENGVEDASYLKLLIENKTDKTIWVTPDNVSANDIMLQTGSGVPMTIAPGASSRQPFILFTNAAGIGSADEIDELSFRMLVYDNSTMDLLEESVQYKIYRK